MRVQHKIFLPPKKHLIEKLKYSDGFCTQIFIQELRVYTFEFDVNERN